MNNQQEILVSPKKWVKNVAQNSSFEASSWSEQILNINIPLKIVLLLDKPSNSKFSQKPSLVRKEILFFIFDLFFSYLPVVLHCLILYNTGTPTVC